MDTRQRVALPEIEVNTASKCVIRTRVAHSFATAKRCILTMKKSTAMRSPTLSFCRDSAAVALFSS
jgi:hypothetical protein